MAERGGPDPGTGPARQRIDKWLWHARVVKTRSLAQKLAEAGAVRKNRERVEQSSEAVRLGDVLTITLPHRVLVLRVTGFSERRGSATDAQALFEDLSPPPPPRDPPASVAPAGWREPGSGRPTKRERRALDDFLESDDE